MKNIVSFNTLQKCDACNMDGFFVDTPCGGDYITCPCCGAFYSSDDKELGLTAEELKEIDDEETNKGLPFCKKCHILFGSGCMHSLAGCTDNTYNGHFIGEWKDTTTGGDICWNASIRIHCGMEG